MKIGDRVNIVDDAGELYLSARILKLETSVVEDSYKATLGEYLIKDSGISQRVEDLATQFAELAANRTFYTWIAYADDETGTGISLDPTGKAYLGTAVNQAVDEVSITDPTIFTWSKIKGDPGTSGENGEDATLLHIDSSEGTVFKDKSATTVLTATIFRGANRITNAATLAAVFGNEAYLQWRFKKAGESSYSIISSDDSRLSNGGFTLTVSMADVDTSITYSAELIT